MRKIKPSSFTYKDIDAALDRLRNAIVRQLCLKGNEAFYSPLEGLGVITEEYHELITAIHENNAVNTAAESLDLAVAAIWQNMTSEDYITRYIKDPQD